MSKKIDINNLEWIKTVSNGLNMKLNDLKYVHKVLSDFDDFLDDTGVADGFVYNFKSQQTNLDNLSDDIKLYGDLVGANTYDTSSNGYSQPYNSNMNTPSGGAVPSALSLVYEIDYNIDRPFFKAMVDCVERISNINLSSYETKNTNGIMTKEEGWVEDGYRNYKRVLNDKKHDNLNIEDLLKSSLSRTMFQNAYESYLKVKFKTIEDVSELNFDMYYKEYISILVNNAEFDYTTGIEGVYNTIRFGITVVVIGGAIILSGGSMLAVTVPGAAAISTVVTVGGGVLTAMDVLHLATGKDINGNPLTPEAMRNLQTSLAIDAVMLGIGIYSKIKLKNIKKASGGGSVVDDILKKHNLETADDVWNLKATDRGKIIEELEAATGYKDWWNCGSENGGYFPIVDFQKGNDVVSMKTIDPRLPTYANGRVNTKIMDYIDDLNRVILVDGEAAIRILDVKIPKGCESLLDVIELQKYAVKKNIILKIKEW